MPQPLIEGLVSLKGRITRTRFWSLAFLLAVLFVLAFNALETTIGRGSTLILYPFLFWIAFSLACRRYHDLGKPAWWLLLLAIPLLGPIWVGIELAFRRGTTGANRYGDDPRAVVLDYFQVK